MTKIDLNYAQLLPIMSEEACVACGKANLLPVDHPVFEAVANAALAEIYRLAMLCTGALES